MSEEDDLIQLAFDSATTKSTPPTNCAGQLGYPHLDFLVGTAEANSIRNDRRRQQRDTSAHAAVGRSQNDGDALVTAVGALGTAHVAGAALDTFGLIPSCTISYPRTK